MPSSVIATDRQHLDFLIAQRLGQDGPTANLNNIDVSGIEDFSFLFASRSFWGDVSGWDTARATNMKGMFAHSHFQGDVSGWCVSNVTDMGLMFERTQFTGDLSRWDVARVSTFGHMFSDSPFDGDLSMWKLHPDADTAFMFSHRAAPLWPQGLLRVPLIPVGQDMEALFGYKSNGYDAWLAHAPIDANHWRVLMQVVEASEKTSLHWDSMDITRWPHDAMLDQWMQARDVHQGMGLGILESAQLMMEHSPKPMLLAFDLPQGVHP